MNLRFGSFSRFSWSVILCNLPVHAKFERDGVVYSNLKRIMYLTGDQPVTKEGRMGINPKCSRGLDL